MFGGEQGQGNLRPIPIKTRDIGRMGPMCGRLCEFERGMKSSLEANKFGTGAFRFDLPSEPR